MMIKCYENLDDEGKMGVVIMQLLNTCDCVNHILLIFEFNVFINRHSNSCIHSYLTKRKESLKVNSSNKWEERISGVP